MGIQAKSAEVGVESKGQKKRVSVGGTAKVFTSRESENAQEKKGKGMNYSEMARRRRVVARWLVVWTKNKRWCVLYCEVGRARDTRWSQRSQQSQRVEGSMSHKKSKAVDVFCPKGTLREVNILLILPFLVILCFQVGADNPKGCSPSSDGLKKEF